MHARSSARDTYRWSDRFFQPGGDITFESPIDAQEFSEAYALRGGRLSAAEAMAMSLLHEVFHRVIGCYRRTRPDAFARLLDGLRQSRPDDLRAAVHAFAATFPPPAIYHGHESVERHFEARGDDAVKWAAEELVLLWLVNQNPAYDPARPIVSDAGLPPAYKEVIASARQFFAEDAPFGPQGENLIDLLLAPSRHAPHSIFAQIAYVATHWAGLFGLEGMGLLERLGIPIALDRERHRWLAKGVGPGAPRLEPLRFGDAGAEEMRFSPDTDWMPRVVLLAKSVYVWLDQLARRYGREVRRLDQVPEEELAWLSRCGFSGLWLIGVFERSRASRKIKRMRGDYDALASAYALRSYEIAEELGGEAAWHGLSERAGRYGIRLAADMVPNHVAIDADWVVNHPDWFLQTAVPPFPNYRYTSEDLSEDSRVGVQIEDGYWSHTDAAVVFRRFDRWTGSDTFIYHGNDGTSMPWNDTAQLDYTKPEVRQAVIQTILHVARMFPIIRFDAAMTLAKRHYQRLWFPLPGHGSDIPSRSAFAMTQEELDRRMPVEFWREVVDTVAREAPDTLLLAEAFWLMEGYFVRTLGMHRVYNSAFMNMLKREENGKYRETIRNVLDFDPRVLERFVNFMSNPDEETAIAQFGDGDKYFGVCVLMSTMPGLPMFGHGQVEGLHEKYGMEYARAKWDEAPKDWMIARHEREIFPLLRRRHVFSGVTNFALYDFNTEFGVNHDVFAYSNRAGDDRAIVLFHNKWAETRGSIHGSVPYRGADGALHTRTLVEALDLPRGGDAFVRFRDATGGLEYLRTADELANRGLYAELRAFQYHVFLDFGLVHDSLREPWRALASEIGGRGVPSLDRSLKCVRFRLLHEALRGVLTAVAGDAKDGSGTASGTAAGSGTAPASAAGSGTASASAAGSGTAPASASASGTAPASASASGTAPASASAAAAASGTASAAVSGTAAVSGAASASGTAAASGTAPAAASGIAPSAAVSEVARELVSALVGAVSSIADREGRPRPDPSDVLARSTQLLSGLERIRRPQTATLRAWVALDAALELLEGIEPGASATARVDAAALDTPIADAFRERGIGPEVADTEAAAIVLLATLPAELDLALAAMLDDPRGRWLLHIHTAGGVEWLNQERWEELTRLLAARDQVLAVDEPRADAFKEIAALAARAGFDTQKLRTLLAARRPRPA